MRRRALAGEVPGFFGQRIDDQQRPQRLGLRCHHAKAKCHAHVMRRSVSTDGAKTSWPPRLCVLSGPPLATVLLGTSDAADM
jgi:hypothetical protein